MTMDWTEKLEAQASAWTGVIPGSNPSGVDVRYDPAYEALAQEVAKLDVPQATNVDWELVERGAVKLLANKSKDILVACWLAASLHEQRGLEGLAVGLWAIGSTVDTFWESLFPPLTRMKARVSALTWLLTRTVMRIEADSGSPTHDVVEQLALAVKRLQRIVADRFADHAPGMRPLGDAVERLRLSLPPRPVAEPTQAAEVGAPAVIAQPTIAEPATAAVLAEPATAPAVVADESAEGATTAAAGAATAPPSHADVLEERVRRFLAPIPGASLAGPDARYDPTHEALRTEVAKLDDPGGAAVAWDMVASRGEPFLERNSKDLLIACYVAWARFELDGLDGLSTGIALLTGIIGVYWDDLHPNRPRSRANALAWLISRVDQALSGSTPKGGSNRVVVDRLSVAARTFAALVRDKFGDDAPGLRPLLDGIERMKLSLPADAPPPSTTPHVTTAAAPAAAPAPQPASNTAAPVMPATPSTFASGAEITPFLQQVGGTLTAAATALRSASPSDANAYRLRRLGLYMATQAPPPVTAAPKTQVSAPQSNLRKQLEVLRNNAKWDALLDEAESALTQSRFWLDLHRYVVLALDGLGHADARDAVIAETSYLLRRFPSLSGLTFADATPFASSETREWLDSIAGSASGSSNASAAASDDPLEEVLRVAKALQAEGKRDEAMKSIVVALRTAADERTRFRLRLGAARLCAGSTALAGARALFDGLVQDLDRLQVAQWDPALALDVLRAYYEALREPAKANPRLAEEAADVYRRLCRLDPLAALQ